jgi:tetratricopeptide (TPR) repeat protein
MNLSENSYFRLPLFFFFFVGIIYFCYSNTFQASWHLDDEPNILTNSNLHITELSLQQVSRTLQAHPFRGNQDKFYRPLPCLTFGLNWYIGQDNVFGYHVVNIAIHILTAWFLFLTLQLLLHIHYKKQYPPQFFTAAALLAALLWALAPIQTQAVTYIVQRMASMAAMFCIIFIYTYLRGRIASEKKYIWYFFCVLAFFAALGSKENAILLLPSLVLLEFSFFKHNGINKRQVVIFAVTASILLIAAAFFVHSMLGHLPFNFLDGYKGRSFTFSERILTQPRIVLMYLSQIFLPVTDRLSIEHEINLSGSLFSPWSTFPSIILIFFLIVGSFSYLKKYPMICFPVLFFFLNHAVESTIFPLELIFEHRNYLPSLFLFLPLGIPVAHILYSSPPQSLFRRIAVTLCTVLFLIISGHATYTRNLTWATEGTLWTDVLRKTPNSPRAAHNLGRYYHELGQYQLAYHYFQLSLKNAERAANPKRSQQTTLNALGAVASIIGNHEKSRDYYERCLDINKRNPVCLENSILAYLRSGLPENALIQAKKLINEYPEPVNYQYLTATAAYQADHNDIAIKYMRKIAGRSLYNQQIMYLAGILLMKEKAYQNSLFFLKRAAKLAPKNINYQLTLATAFYNVNRSDLAERILDNIFNKHPLPVIINAVPRIEEHNLNSDTTSLVKAYFDDLIKKTNITTVDYGKQPHNEN